MAELTAEQKRFIEWSALPEKERVPSSKARLAAELDVSDETIRRWGHAAWYRDELSRAYALRNASPERMQAVVDALWTAAEGGDVQAATKYLDYLRSIGAVGAVVEERGVEDMSDEELQEAWESQFSGI